MADQDRLRPGQRRWMLTAGTALLALAAAFAGVMRAIRAHPPVAAMDHWWLSLMTGIRNTPLTDAFKVLSLICGPDGGTVIVAVLCVMLLVVRRWRTALYLAVAEAAGSASSQLVKHIVDRHRPAHPLVTADVGSFPSGHVITTLSVGIALAVVFARPGHRRYPLAGVAVATALMMFCRTYLAAHWLSDTFESILIGGGLALVLWALFDPMLARDRGRPLRQRPVAESDAAESEAGQQVLAHRHVAQAGQIEEAVDALQHRGDVGVQPVLVAASVEEQHRIRDVPGRWPGLLDDAIDLWRAGCDRAYDLVAHVAGARLQLAG
jgi:membrane-associated phospholipid phosphatase